MDKIDPRTLLELDIPKTDRQIEYLKAVIEYGSNSKAAEKLGINRRSIDRSIKLVEHKAALSRCSTTPKPKPPNRRGI